MNPKRRASAVFFLFALFIPLFLTHPSISSGQTAQEYIDTGETQLFSETVTGILNAYNTFQTAKSAYPNDPVINAYLAITRLFDLALREDGTGATDLAARYGILRSGADLDTLEFQPNLIGDEYISVPETAPSGETLRSFAAGTVLNALNASIANLDTTLGIWTPTSKRIVSSTKTGNSLDLEWDYGDVILLRAGLKMAKALVLVATAYDVDVDVREVIALGNIGALNFGKLLDRYQDLLKLLPTTKTPTGNGASQITTARTTLLSGIDDYLVASNHIRNDSDTATGAEELIVFDAEDRRDEELFRQNLTELKASLDQNRTADLVLERVGTEYHVYGGSSFSTTEPYWWNKGYHPEYYGYSYLGSSDETATFSGSFSYYIITTYRGNVGPVDAVRGSNGVYYGTSITGSTLDWGNISGAPDGTYALVGGDNGGKSGGFVVIGPTEGLSSITVTIVPSGVDRYEEHLSINLNPFFSNKPDLRNMLPLFDCDDEPIGGTMGYGLNPANPDATLGGILPGFTQDDWGFEGTATSGEISVPWATINVQDGSINDWAGIDPVYVDPAGDGYPDRSGSDLQNLYLAKDSQFLYIRMTLADGPPSTAYVAAPRQTMGYFVRFRNQAGEHIGSRVIQVDYPGSGTWRVQTWEQVADGQTRLPISHDSGYAQAFGNNLEFKVPLADVGSITGKFLTTWIQWIGEGIYGGEPPEYNETCLRIGPLSSVRVNLTVPDYDGTGLIFVSVYRDDGGFNPADQNRIGDLLVLYPGQYTPGMNFVLDGMPVGETVWVSTRWDADFNGIRTKGDYSKSTGPVTIAADGSTAVTLNANSLYVEDQASPYFRLCNALVFRSTTTTKSAFYAEVFDPNGTVPGTISQVRVTYPDGITQEVLTHSGGNAFYKDVDISAQFVVGQYTFTVTDTEGLSATSYFYYGGGPDLPIPDATTLQVAGNWSAATLSWGGVAGYAGNVFYRARIFGQAGNTIWTSGFTTGTSMAVPGNVLQQVSTDAGPKWRVEAFDSHSYQTSYRRSVTNQVSFAFNNNKPYFDFAVVFHRKDADGDWTQVETIVRDRDGTMPTSITSLDVYDSSNNLICSLHHADPQRRLFYDSAFEEFVVKIPGSPSPGVYRFVVSDDQGNTKTTYDYAGASFGIPVVDSSTYQAWGDPLTPILSWAAPAGVDRPIYYRVIIEDGTGARAWGSDRFTDTAVQVPSGLLQPGVAYTWYVRTKDNKNWGHFDNQGRAARSNLAVNSLPNPYFKWTGVHRRHDADGSFTGLSAGVIDPAGTLPGSITTLTVTSPLGNTYDLKNNGNYDAFYSEFFLRATGPFEPGVYTFTLVKGGFTLTAYDWIDNTPEMPLVDQMTITVSGDTTAPTVSWSGVSGFPGNVYYRLRVQDQAGNQIYSTSRDPLTAQTIPMGRLEPGKTYLARVEAQEHPDFITYNSRSNTPYVWWNAGEGMPIPPPPMGTSFVSGILDVPGFDGQGAITITVYRSEAGDFNPAPENLLGTKIITPAEYSQGMVYMVSGLPVGAEVFVTATWDADSDGDYSRGDYTTKTGPFMVTQAGVTGQSLVPTTMFGYDEASPYIGWCNVQAFYVPGTPPNNVQGAYSVQVFDPNGGAPDTISTVTVTGPGVNYTFVVPADHYGGGMYWHGIAGQTPQIGEYTFTVTDNEGKTATSRYYFPGGTAIPLPDTASLQASGNPLAPTLSWGAISTYEGNLFYRARIYDGTGNQTLWTSDFTPNTSVNVPSAVLSEGLSYQWRVEAFDDYRYEASNRRAVSAKIPLAIGTGPYFNSATVFHRHDYDGTHSTQFEAIVVDPNGSAPSTIASLEVFNPSGTLVYSFSSADYQAAFKVYFKKLTGMPDEGLYRFVVTDTEGKSATSYDYVKPGTIPLVGPASLQASGPNPAAPMLSWAAASEMGRPLYYRAIVEDMAGNRKWASGWTTNTSAQMPTGILQQGGSYRWYVRTADDMYYVHYNDESRCATKDLVLSEPVVGMDNIRPFFNWAVVFKRHEPGGIYTTLSASVTDPNGMAPGSLQSLVVTGPGGFSQDMLGGEYTYLSQYNEISFKVPGAPAAGVYTFMVTDNEGITAVSYDWVGEAADIPLPDQASIQVSGNPMSPTVSWSGVSGYQGNLFYRVLVQDLDGNIVYLSPRDALTAHTIPYGVLQAGSMYLVRAEAQDHRTWGVYNSRSNSGWVLWATGEEQASGISGRVTDEFGSPIANLNIYAQSGSCQGPWAGGTNTDQNGEYTLVLPPGTYFVRACASCSALPYTDKWYPGEWMCEQATPVFVQPSQVTAMIDFALSQCGSISGRVVDTLGNPIANLHLYASDYILNEWRGGAITGTDGYYSIFVPTGTYRVRTCASCNDQDFVDEWYNDTNLYNSATEVQVTVPNDTSGIDFELEATLKRPSPGEAAGDGLAWLAGQQNPDGSWGGIVAGTKYELAKTALAVLAFEKHAKDQGKMPLDPTYTYQANVVSGLNFIFANAAITAISPQPAGNPDGNSNHKGVYFTWAPDTHHVNYYTAIAAMAIAASGDPNAVVDVTGSAVNGWTYRQVVQDVVDFLAYGQTDSGLGRGGWNYGATNSDNTRSDQSNSGWVTLALAYAEAAPPEGLGITIPGFVRTQLDMWINTIQDPVNGDDNDGGSCYSDPAEGMIGAAVLRTGNLLQQMAFVGDTTATQRVQAALDFMARHWQREFERANPICYQAAYTTMKGLEAMGVETIGSSLNWFANLSDRIREQQAQSGSWPAGCYDDGDKILSTAWSVLTLQKAVAPTEENPDLAISNVQVTKGTGNYTVSFTVRNRGNMGAPAGLDAGLSVNGVPVGQVAVPLALDPEQTYTSSFSPVTWTSGRQEIRVCADVNGEVGELNEDNNCFLLIWPPITPGDMNSDDDVTLADAILGLRVVSGMNPAGVHVSADVDADGKIGITEVIYVLQKVSGLQP